VEEEEEAEEEAEEEEDEEGGGGGGGNVCCFMAGGRVKISYLFQKTFHSEVFHCSALSFQAHAWTVCCPREGRNLPRPYNLLFVIFCDLTVCELCSCKRCLHIGVLHISRIRSGHLKTVSARRVT
jgi:hypothetical protein